MKKALLYFFIAFIALRAQAQQTETRYLSGKGSDDTVPWEFFLTEGRNSGKWTTIPVPSNWELQGFGKYNYGFAKDSSRGKEKGMYKHRFQVPANWKGRKVEIVFEGAMTDTDVKVNGVSAGPRHEGSYYAFRFDVSKLVKYGEDNLLEATVAKHSENKSVNAAERNGDFWIFGGIFRPVYLEAFPAAHISRVAVDAAADGQFKAQVYLGGVRGGTVSAQLYGADGKKTGAPMVTKVAAGDSAVTVKGKLVNPRLWSPEFPNLYQVVFTLAGNGKTEHIIAKKIGFRTVKVKERDGIYVNDVKIKFKGVCRHSFWPSSGRALNNKISVEDVQLMKDMNMNAVRMSHYPPDAHFLDVCDSLGLFVMDELAGWHGMYDTPTGTRLVKEMLDRDVNHPSIVFWANGNEGGHNLELDTLFTQQDPQQRPVLHPWQLFSGIETDHYREYAYGIGNYMQGHNIVMPTEFLHGMYDGGHGAGLEDYWEAMWQNPLAAGGFLWDFADEGVVRTDKNGIIDTDGNHGADGIVGPYHEKEGSYFAIREIWSPVVFQRKEITPAFDGKLTVENRFFYTNLNQCKFSWQLATLRGTEAVTTGSGSADAPSIRPSEKGTLRIPLPSDWAHADVLYVTATDPHGREIFRWSFPITRPNAIAATLVDTVGRGRAAITTSDSLYRVSINDLSLSFNRNSGMLSEVRRGNQQLPFANGPVLQEGVNNFGNFSQQYVGNNLVIRSTFDRKNNYNMLEWTVYPSGWIKMKVNYFPAAYFTTMVGVNFSLTESVVKGVQYLGSGPYRVWKNRMKGNSLGIWNKAYNNSATGEIPFAYPEFKGYHANMYWAKILTTGQPITVVTENEDIFLRLFTPKLSDDPYHNLDPVFPSGDISFMQGISGIGTKTQKSETTGPMGMKHIYYDYEKEPARAKEIVLYFNFSGK